MVEQPPPMHRITYGHQEIEFMVPPWFAVDVLSGPADQVTAVYDVIVAGLGAPHDAELGMALRALMRLAPRRVVRENGAIVIAAQLPDGAGEDDERGAAELALTLRHCLVVVAASEEPEIVRLAKLRASLDVEEALEIAYEHIGRPERASLLIVPRAPHALPVVRDPAGVGGRGGPA